MNFSFFLLDPAAAFTNSDLSKLPSNLYLYQKGVCFFA